MKTWICTPLANFFSPMQGASRLYAYVKNAGYDVRLKDLNQNAYFSLLSKPYLEEYFDKSKAVLEPLIRSPFLRNTMGSILLNSSNNAIRQVLAEGLISNESPYALLQKLPTLKKAALGLAKYQINNANIFYLLLSEREFFIQRIEQAREVIDKNFFALAPEEFLSHFQTLLCGKALIDAVYFPAQLDFGFGFHGTAYAPSASDVIRASQDKKFNFLIPYYQKEVLPLLEQEQPGMVGISITHTADFIPAFTLARLIKLKASQIHICLGGSTLTEVAHRIARNPALWDFFDSIISGPGECAFTELIECLEKKKDLSSVPNLIYKENGSLKKSLQSHEFDLSQACTPEFVCLRPKTPLPLETSSGCYWGKCIFCYYPKMGVSNIDSPEQQKRTRRIELVVKDIAALRDRYDPLYIGFTDSTLSPQRLEQIAESNLKSNKKVSFSAFIRFEKEFISESFCRKISAGGFLGGQVGLESGSQRVNNIINKGVGLKDAVKILQNFYKTGILMHVYSIVGIPGETLKDARQTLKFIKRYHRLITLGWQVYSLYVLEHGPLIERQEEFGLHAQPLPDDYLVQAMQYDLEKGLSQEEGISLSVEYTERLKKHLEPLIKVLDIEMYKGILLMRKAKTYNRLNHK